MCTHKIIVKLGENETVMSKIILSQIVPYSILYMQYSNTFNNFIFHNLPVVERRLSILSIYKQISKNSAKDNNASGCVKTKDHVKSAILYSVWI